MRAYLHLLVFVALATLSWAEVKVWEGKLPLPTYEEGMPDPNPAFDQFASNRFNYPYTLRDKLTSHRVNHDLRAIYIENEYLKCSVLPDIGGHLYTCIDKISGQSMFYANPSIKKAGVGYRGAWAAFGIEFNFPVSHNWVSMSPVNFAFHKNADGSGSVIVGNVDRVYGMEWTVELLLRPQSTLLEERVTLSNRSDVRHRFYWWNNAAAKISDDSRIVYPMRFAASHGFTEVTSWPMDEDGHDLSIIRNHVHGAVSLFTHGSRENFMGVWHPATKTGTVHFAEYEDLPAKKIWSWGVDAEGLDWRRALSDDNSGYIEIQAGLFRNQETYSFMEPRQSIQFSEYWMPVREIDGISRANLAGVLSIDRRGSNLRAGFNANQVLPRATVAIRNGNKRLFDETVNLMPDHAWTHEVPLTEAAAKYTVEIRDAHGVLLIRQTEGEYDGDPESEIRVGPQTPYRIPDKERRTCDDWIQLGKEYELNGRIVRALDIYKEALRRYPGSLDASKAAGRLAATLLRYDEAKTYLESAHARHTADPEVSYYLGVVYDSLSETRKAQTAYEEAQRFSSFRPASALKLGEMLAREGKLAESERHLAVAVGAAPGDTRSLEELVAVTFATGNSQKAKALAEQGILRFPLSLFLREELGNPDLKLLANDSTRVLNVAAQYIRLGLYQRALVMLSRNYPPPQADQSEPGELAPGKHPMMAYFRAYCRERLGQTAADDYTLASQLSTSYVFPSSTEELIVLRNAVRANPEDASAHYLLGTLYFSRGLTEPALAEWSRARATDRNIPVLDANLGLALLHEKHDPEGAIVAFRDGLRTDPANVTIYRGADEALSLVGRPAREIAQILEKFPDLDNAPSGLIFELILSLCEAGDFQRAEDLFHNRFFAREEGGTNVRQVWIEVEVQKLLSLARNGHCADALQTGEHLGAAIDALPFTRDGLEPFLQSARTNYLVATAYAACARSQEAQRHLQIASAASAPDELLWAWLAAKKLSAIDERQWRERLQSALLQVINRSENSSYPGWWDYSAGAIATALGQKEEADFQFQKALLLPDRMLSYHFTRLARLETVH
jgi:tetratricopeptide (TPR) repeat protein